MLAKLIKYDFRSCWKRFWPFWMTILILSVINGITNSYRSDSGMSGFLVVALPIILLFCAGLTTFVYAIVYICEEFHNGLLGKPGYLMFTLPVTKGQLIASKGIVALIVELISIAVSVVSSGIMALICHPQELSGFFGEIREAMSGYRIPSGIWILLAGLIILGIGALVNFNLRIHASISVGHLARKRRTLLAFVAYILFGAALSWLSVVMMQILFESPLLYHLFGSNSEIGIHPGANGLIIEGFGKMMGILGIGILWEALLATVYFLICRLILNRRLNLE